MFIKIIRSELFVKRGVMLIDGELFCMTLELPWRNNEQNVSCIPVGTYKAKKYTSGKAHIGKTLAICDVPNRSGIAFHIGNTVEDSEGCILLGEQFSQSGKATLYNSASAIARFREKIKEATSFTVSIVDAS